MPRLTESEGRILCVAPRGVFRYYVFHVVVVVLVVLRDKTYTEWR